MRCTCHKFGCLICDPMALSQGISVDTSPNMPEPTTDQLRADLKSVTAERDRYKAALAKIGADICEHAEDTVWVGNGQTLIDRLCCVLDVDSVEELLALTQGADE